MRTMLVRLARALRRPFARKSDRSGRPGSHRELLLESGLFEAAWYLETYPDVAAARVDPMGHYLNHGWREGRSPGPDFDVAYYLTANPDVAAAAIEPVLHYVRHGAREGRRGSANAKPGQASAQRRERPALRPIATAKEVEADEFFGWVARRAVGRHVVWLGSPSQDNIERLLRLLEGGAASARLPTSEIAPSHDDLFHALVQAMPLAPAIKERLAGFERLERARIGYGMWSRGAGGETWHAQSFLGDPELLNKVGPIDLLVTTDVLHLNVEPMRLLQAVRAASPGSWFVEVPITPETQRDVGKIRVSLTQDTILYAGSGTSEEATVLQGLWEARGVKLPQFTGLKGKLSPAAMSMAGQSGVWWWFWGRKAVEKLCLRAGFDVIEAEPLPSRPMHAFRLDPTIGTLA